MITTKSKYKVGDYITADDYVIRKVLAVVEDGLQPVYAVDNPKGDKDDIKWVTEFELDEDSMSQITPDFASYHALEAGDILHMGQASDREYTTVIARVGDLVLLSMAPHSHELKQATQLSDQLKELTDGEVDLIGSLDEDTKKALKKHSSSRWTKNVASMWRSVEWICLMNWPIVKE